MTTELRHLLAIYVHAHRTGNSVPPHIDAEARAALADEPAVPEGREPVAVTGQFTFPADGEVAELVADLRQQANHGYCEFISRDDLLRAADLLQRLSQPVPVPVRIADGVYWRWPEFSDCDDTDRVWCWNWAIGTWRINRINRSIHSHWLPAHALPIPQQQETVND